MSVGSCAYLYSPDEPFNANTFESWFHYPCLRYEPDQDLDAEPTLAEDYIPSYSWFDAAAEQLLAARKKKANPKPVSRPSLYLVPASSKRAENTSERVVSESKYQGCSQVKLIESSRLAREALSDNTSHCYSYEELRPYLDDLKKTIKLFERDLKPSLVARGLQLVLDIVNPDSL